MTKDMKIKSIAIVQGIFFEEIGISFPYGVLFAFPNAAPRGPYGYHTANALGDTKEQFDFYWNQAYKGLSENDAQKDKIHDLGVNASGRLRGDSGLYNNAKDACAEYRAKNPAFPEKYW